MTGKQLADKYKDFVYPCVKIFIGGKEIPAAEGRSLENVEVNASTGKEPDMAVFIYQVSKRPASNMSDMESFIDVGKKVEIKAGYDEIFSRIFLGYLHEVQLFECGQGYWEYTFICLDVKGLMKKINDFQISGKNKIQQIVKEIFNSDIYSNLIEKKSIGTLPDNMNTDCVVRGESHYDFICNLADVLGYEFFCGCGEVVFKQAKTNKSETVELERKYGLQAVQLTASLAEQTGSITINGYNRKDEKISGVSKRSNVSGPFCKEMGKILKNCSRVILDMGLETGEQADSKAKAVMNGIVDKCLRMSALNIGLPELKPGGYAKITEEDAESLSGKIYIEEVTHLIDKGGYRTTVRGPKE